MTQREKDLLDHEILIYLQQYFFNILDGVTEELLSQYEQQWLHLKKNATEHSKYCKGPWNPCDKCIVEAVQNTARLYEHWRERHSQTGQTETED